MLQCLGDHMAFTSHFILYYYTTRLSPRLTDRESKLTMMWRDFYTASLIKLVKQRTRVGEVCTVDKTVTNRPVMRNC